MKLLNKLAPVLLLIPCLLCAGTLEDFGESMSNFYLSPTPEKFEEFQKQAAEFQGMLSKTDNGSDLLVSVMLARIAEKHSWPIQDESKLGKKANEILKGESKLAKYIADDSQVDPRKLDIWWASYFATGDESYLEKILTYAGEEMPKNDINKMLIIGAATWSFKANCKQHDSVHSYALQSINEPRCFHKKQFLNECAGTTNSAGFSWRDKNGAPIPDTKNQKSKDGFGVELFLTDNVNFYDDWKRPETPRISIAKTAQIGTPIIPLVIYVNPKPDENKIINVTCDVTIIRPDGSVAQEIPSILCGTGVFEAPQYNLQLSQTEIRWSVDEGDPVGTWTFNVIVKDNNRGIKIPLTTSVEITK